MSGVVGAAIDGRLGTQVWFESTDTRARVDALLDRAVAIGFGQIRIFLMWPWIQAQSPDAFDFRLWDDVFDSAHERQLGVKATLTANSGPWWMGTGSVLHSHTMVLEEAWWPSVDAYVGACVDRYADHPALRQWIVWNEPGAPFDLDPAPIRPTDAGASWHELLERRYGTIGELNSRWRTGFTSFADVPFWEDTHHRAHRRWPWRSFGPLMMDAELRATLLEQQLGRIIARIQARDAETPLCLNPNQTLVNHAASGIRITGLSQLVDVLGASFHAPWAFGYARPEDHAPLVTAGLGLLASAGAKEVEVTEFQTGNTFYAGTHAIGADAASVAASHLQPLLAGAASVTGWCFNTRTRDFEAGEWGLLEDDDRLGPRAGAVQHVREVIAQLDALIGEWHQAQPLAAVLMSVEDHALQFCLSQVSQSRWGTDPDAGAHAAALTTIALERLGFPTELAMADQLADSGSRSLIVATHMTAWTRDVGHMLLERAARGATVIVDATSGQFDEDAALHKPWPGVLADHIGARSAGLDTARSGDPAWDVYLHGGRLGVVEGVRSRIDILDPAWSASPGLNFSDGTPIVWSRAWGGGRIVLCGASIGLSLIRGHRLAATAVLHACAGVPEGEPRPMSPDTQLEIVNGPGGQGIGVFGPPAPGRTGPIAVAVQPGRYLDLWTGRSQTVGHARLLQLDAPDGIALLVARGQ